MRTKTISVIASLIVALSFFGQYEVSSSLTGTNVPNTPIKHIVFIIQENHAFDNFFASYPGLNSSFTDVSSGVCLPYSLVKNLGCVSPYNGDSQALTIEKGSALPHTYQASHTSYNNGSMNGFVSAIYSGDESKTTASYAMAYFDGAIIPNYWDYASQFTLDANFFSSALSYSLPNHDYIVAANEPPSCKISNCSPTFNLKLPVIVQELQKAHITWDYFAGTGNWKDSDQCIAMNSKSLTSNGFYWNPLTQWPGIQDSATYCHHIETTQDLTADLAKGDLPQVSFVTPNNTVSDHLPYANITRGQIYVSQIINSIMNNASLWSSTAIFLTWDDYGGFYDNIAPVQVDAGGYGFRVPLIVISPYSVQGISYGNGKQQDFTAVLSTIESNWNLGNLTDRDGNNSPLWYLFNFKQTPLNPLILPSNILATYPVSSCTVCLSSSGTPYFSPTAQPIQPDTNATYPTVIDDDGGAYD